MQMIAVVVAATVLQAYVPIKSSIANLQALAAVGGRHCFAKEQGVCQKALRSHKTLARARFALPWDLAGASKTLNPCIFKKKKKEKKKKLRRAEQGEEKEEEKEEEEEEDKTIRGKRKNIKKRTGYKAMNQGNRRKIGQCSKCRSCTPGCGINFTATTRAACPKHILVGKTFIWCND
jgi:hypothetical protein